MVMMELYLSGFGSFLYSKFATAPGSKTKEVRDEILEGKHRDHLYLLESFASYRGGGTTVCLTADSF